VGALPFDVWLESIYESSHVAVCVPSVESGAVQTQRNTLCPWSWPTESVVLEPSPSRLLSDPIPASLHNAIIARRSESASEKLDVSAEAAHPVTLAVIPSAYYFSYLSITRRQGPADERLDGAYLPRLRSFGAHPLAIK
jgi:hypothetical protein